MRAASFIGAAARPPTSYGPELATLVTLVVVVGLVAVYVWVCVLIARAAVAKGRSYRAWFAISFFVSPILAAIIIASVTPIAQVRGASALVPCPRCAEPIREAASVCRFCGTELEEDDFELDESETE